MNTLKSGFVVAVMLAAGYGAYVMMVKPPPMPGSNASLESDWSQAQLEIGSSLDHTDQAADETEIAIEPESTTNQLPVVQLPQEQNIKSPGPTAAITPTNPVTPANTTPVLETASILASETGQAPTISASQVPNVPPISTDPILADIPTTSTDIAAVVPFQENSLETVSSEPVTSTSDTPSQETKPVTEKAILAGAFEEDWQAAESQLATGKLTDTLFTLSTWYESPELSEEQNARLLQRLDQLAGSVIYSREHSMHPSYQVRTGETLESIAQHFQVPWQFLANVNGIVQPSALIAGQELKIVHGPFHSKIDLDRRTLTVFLGRLYGGRFNIQLGQNPFPDPGEQEVLSKMLNGLDFVGSDGQLLSASDPTNPYGKMIIQLTDNLVIHTAATAGTQPAPGCIMLHEQDVLDLYAILSVNSRVIIKSNSPRRQSSGAASSLGYYER